PAQVILKSRLLIVGHEIGQTTADHLLDAVAKTLGGAGVDGEHAAFEIVGADHAERAFHQLAVASFAGVESRGGFTLIGDVDSGHDDEVDLAGAVGQVGGGPRNETAAALAGEPVQFSGVAAYVAARLFEQLKGFRALFSEEQLLGEG